MTSSKQKLAVIDLGSNSFHLIIAILENNSLQIIDREKEIVRLASGIDSENRINDDKIVEATDCLKIFGQLIQDFHPRNVQCVGTNTLRKAINSRQFLRHAQQALGFPISIIGGREEARLVYQGVARTIAQTVPRRLVIDIGGGSTEFIIGEENTPILMESLTMGCINFTRQFFASGKITKKKINKAVLAARQKLEWISDEYIEMGWQETIGSSGTIKTIASILALHYEQTESIKLKHLKLLAEKLISFGSIEQIEIEGLSANRSDIIIGGLCVLIAAFEELEIKSMLISKGALREGLLHDMQNTAGGRDIRFTSVKQMMQRYNVDNQQSAQIKKIAAVFTQQLKIDKHKEILYLIEWTIDLHEVGLTISHVNTAQHSAYIVEQSDMPGFSRGLQNTIGILLRLHRSKVKKKLVEECTEKNKQLLFAVFVIRLSVMLARGRDRMNLEETKVIKEGKNIELIFPEKFLATHPLTLADLEQEKDETKKLGFKLKFRDSVKLNKKK